MYVKYISFYPDFLYSEFLFELLCDFYYFYVLQTVKILYRVFIANFYRSDFLPDFSLIFSWTLWSRGERVSFPVERIGRAKRELFERARSSFRGECRSQGIGQKFHSHRFCFRCTIIELRAVFGERLRMFTLKTPRKGGLEGGGGRRQFGGEHSVFAVVRIDIVCRRSSCGAFKSTFGK